MMISVGVSLTRDCLQRGGGPRDSCWKYLWRKQSQTRGIPFRWLETLCIMWERIYMKDETRTTCTHELFCHRSRIIRNIHWTDKVNHSLFQLKKNSHSSYKIVEVVGDDLVSLDQILRTTSWQFKFNPTTVTRMFLYSQSPTVSNIYTTIISNAQCCNHSQNQGISRPRIKSNCSPAA